MPRYYFDIHDGAFAPDHTGMHLPDLAAARKMAIRTLTDIASEELPENGDQKKLAVIVREEDGPAVLSLEIRFDVHKQPTGW